VQIQERSPQGLDVILVVILSSGWQYTITSDDLAFLFFSFQMIWSMSVSECSNPKDDRKALHSMYYIE